ncbi:hypothetical protein HUK80_07200 [Flavobacterium sp. MAH-1]|uniref:Uncharacterized protein n=1 Tax=Flavobacterium agri TaxID=2743471 RepID=A0A7Y9C5R8_9FLAO|nr:hypothetical protein [Flavobacterium agri]NUY80675.1 hypothetical protein [Flavobacterium agri]NYA70699.1 hypothetical protein [Flavobacterium agri]
MKAQNLILKCCNCKMPNDKEFNEFVFQQLDNPNVDYCGTSVLHPQKMANENALFLNFHFKHPFEVDEETALEKVTWAFYRRQIEKVKSDNGEIDIFLS